MLVAAVLAALGGCTSLGPAAVMEARRRGLGQGLREARGLTARLPLLPPSPGLCSNIDFWTPLLRPDIGSILTLAEPGI